MNKLLSLLLVAGMLALTGCSSVNTRINEKAALYQSYDKNTQAIIAHGDVGLGFTPDMVYMALGTPDVRRESISASGRTETWIYRSYAYYGYYGYYGYPGAYPYHYHRGYGYGPGYGMYHVYAAPYYGGGGGDNVRVTFENGRVVLIDQART